jgi:hypothetical protein
MRKAEVAGLIGGRDERTDGLLDGPRASTRPIRAIRVEREARRSVDANTRAHRGGSPVKIRLSIDRFEGDQKQIAVLLAEDGTAINFPRALLPKGAKAGDILTLQIERDVEATRKLAADTRKVQDQLKKTDPGGDLKL